METRTYTVYKFDELNDEAKEKAIEHFRRNDDYPFNDDNRKSLERFCEVMPIKATDWEYGYRNYIDSIFDPNSLFDNELTQSEIIEDIKSRLPNIDEACPLTGFHLDEALVEPLRKFIAKPTNQSYEELLKECLSNWINDCNSDYEYCQSDEYIIEVIEAKDYDFLENGEID